ncbi:sialidase family protein [Paenibacillus cymbidii]|uniref:sialidase family protein n=1 Tax=Paenibacillus cymbidii TaxID=1639034 RepID=UPI0010813728|nr:sialidase family protein [Paenibacillus cymbidii]
MNLIGATKQFVFAADDKPTANCHATTLAALADGTIVAAWFGGTEEGKADVDIWGAIRQDGVWSAPFRIAGKEGVAHWNPVLFADSSGTVHLYYKVGHVIPEWVTWHCASRDGGRTWSEPAVLVEGDESGGRGPVKNKPIALQDGTWAAPASIETATHWDAFVDLSADGGKSWTRSAFVPIDHAALAGKGIIQPTLWEPAPGRVHMLLRSTEGAVYRSDSGDGGATWCEAYAIALPNNNSGIDLTQLADGGLALVYNPVPGNWAARSPLVVAWSADNGATWRDMLTLEAEPGEYSYPAIVRAGERLFLTYTWNRVQVAFWELTLE